MRRGECRLPGAPEHVAEARRFVTGLAGDGWLDAGDVALLAGELAANAVLHSASGLPGGKFTVRVIVKTGGYLLIEVEDEGGPWHGPGGDDESGRGLEIVEAVASEWGRAGNAGTGWIVWARMDAPRRLRTLAAPCGPVRVIPARCG